MTLNSTIKSHETKLSILVTAMGKEPAAQKSRYIHAEQYETDLNAVEWISQLQVMLHDLPQAKQDPKHLHIQSVYDRDHFPRLDTDAKEVAEDILNVSFPLSKGGNQRHIGDIPGGISWDGVHKDTGFDPKPNKEEWKVL
jgi:hypothetical protein